MEQLVRTTHDDAAVGGRSARAQRYIPEAVYAELMSLLEEHGRKATRQNKIVSHETVDVRKDHLLLALRELRGLGYKLESVYNLRQKHVEALATTSPRFQ